jgi:hypothetical protein
MPRFHELDFISRLDRTFRNQDDSQSSDALGSLLQFLMDFGSNRFIEIMFSLLVHDPDSPLNPFLKSANPPIFTFSHRPLKIMLILHRAIKNRRYGMASVGCSPLKTLPPFHRAIKNLKYWKLIFSDRLLRI